MCDGFGRKLAVWWCGVVVCVCGGDGMCVCGGGGGGGYLQVCITTVATISTSLSLPQIIPPFKLLRLVFPCYTTHSGIVVVQKVHLPLTSYGGE